MSVALPATLTHAQAPACLAQLQAAVAQTAAGAACAVDCSALAAFDSSALAVLLEARRAALADHKALAVQGMPAHAAQLAQLYGVDGLLRS